MNKKSLFILILIFTVAILLRIWHLGKPEGMWNDEYLSWKIASAAFPHDFFEALKTNCHAPLHYLYLKAWMTIFKDNDLMLRLSSVVPGVLGIVVMYFVSTTFRRKDNMSLAIATTAFCAMSSFLIYFSQEVRIYSLLFFFSTLALLFALRIFENPSKKNFFLYGLFSLLVILTHTIGFVFVFYSTAALFAFGVSKKKSKDYLFLSVIGVILLALPFIPLIAKILFKTGYFSQWWAPFNFSRTTFFITDTFSPVLTDVATGFNTFQDAFYQNGIVNLGYLIFAVVPSLICLVCLIRGVLSPDKKQWYLILTALCTILTVLIASMAGKIVFQTKYIIEIIPILILLACFGLTQFKSRGLRITLATIFTVITLFYITVSNTSAVRMVRKEGQRLPVVALQDMGLKKNDKVFFIYYPSERFLKYVDKSDPNLEPIVNAEFIGKYVFVRLIDYNVHVSETSPDAQKKLQKAFQSPVCPALEDYFNQAIFNKLSKGEKLFFVDLTSVTFFPMSVINQLAQMDKEYEATPLLYLAMSYIKEYLLQKGKSELVYGGYYDIGAWRIYVFEKA